MTQAVKLVKPSRSTNGTGSFGNELNTLVGITWEAGTDYLIFPGETHVGAIAVNASGTATAPIRIGRYGDGPRPRILPNGAARTCQAGTGTAGHGNHVHFMDLDVFGGNSTNGVSTNFGLTCGFSAARASGVKVHRCKIRGAASRNNTTFDHNGFNAFIDGALELLDNEIYEVLDDGVWIDSSAAANEVWIEGNFVGLVDQSGRLLGDCVQITGPARYRVLNNTLDHSSSAAKQAFIISGASASGLGGIFAGNRVKQGISTTATLVSGVYSDQPNDIILANWIEGGNYGVQLVGAKQTAMGNVAIGSEFGILWSSAATDGRCINNTAADCSQRGISFDCTDGLIHNNLLLRNAAGMRRKSTNTYSHNAYWANDTDVTWNGSAGAAESDTVTDDPLLADLFRLQAGSPLIGAGLYLKYAKHFYGHPMSPVSPDIGAFRYFAARAART
jgi:hypothetical protein